MAWVYNVNNAPTFQAPGSTIPTTPTASGGAGAIYILLQTLVQAGWTVVASGDGLGGTYSSSGNVFTGQVGQIFVLSGGAGYSATPNVVISGAGGATATATVSGGVITAITVTAGGSGYSSPPTISITDATGYGATAKCILWPVPIIISGTSPNQYRVATVGSMANPFAWFRIKQPANGTQPRRELIFQNQGLGQGGAPGSETYYTWRVKYEPGISGGFNQAPTGGFSEGAQVPPSGLYEQILVAQPGPTVGTDSNPFPGISPAPPLTNPNTTTGVLSPEIFPTDGTYRWHVVAGDATTNYSFWAMGTTNGTTNPSVCGIALDVFVTGSAPGNHPDPAVLYFDGLNGSNTWGSNLRQYSAFGTNPFNAGARCFFGPPSPGNPSLNAQFGAYWLPISAGAINGFLGGMGQNAWSGKDDIVQVPWMRGATGVSASVPYGFMGWSSLMHYIATNRTNLDTVSSLANTTVSSVTSNGGLVEITTAAATTLVTGSWVNIAGVTGTIEANGVWQVTVIDSTHFTLQNSTFTNAYVSGGAVQSMDLLNMNGTLLPWPGQTPII
jgi:hypothetical protein